ncbi:MAG: PQQ-binding-like beta-propeller repeat protein, partial [Streptosporangiaceae bacterium]
GSSAIQSPVRAGTGRSAASGSSAASGRSGRAGGGAPWEVTVLNALTGRTIRSYPSAAYGGAVSATLTRTVVIGPTAVTCYDNGSGRVIWRDQIGSASQAWHADAGYLYVTVSARGVIGTAPVTAIRQINLRSGAERLIQPPHGPFAGALSGVVSGDLLFTTATGLNIYSAGTGQLIASQPGAVPQGVDPVQHVLYVDAGGVLIGIDPATGARVPHTAVPGPPGIYGVRDGVALGLDPGASGAAWGYSIAKRRVVWTTRSLPWPHYFLDPAGIGGSADPANSTVLIATCARIGPLVQGAALGGRDAYACLRPRLVAISR